MTNHLRLAWESRSFRLTRKKNWISILKNKFMNHRLWSVVRKKRLPYVTFLYQLQACANITFMIYCALYISHFTFLRTHGVFYIRKHGNWYYEALFGILFWIICIQWMELFEFHYWRTSRSRQVLHVLLRDEI